MMDILEKLYFGEIRPAEKDIPGNAMKEKYRKMLQAEEEVMKSLDNELKTLFDRRLGRIFAHLIGLHHQGKYGERSFYYS